MSSRTPEECIELAVDEAADEDEREDAIHSLKMANECDELEGLVRMDELEDHYRQRALQTLATPQCDSTLQELVAEGPLKQSLQEMAEGLLLEMEDKS